MCPLVVTMCTVFASEQNETHVVSHFVGSILGIRFHGKDQLLKKFEKYFHEKDSLDMVYTGHAISQS